MFRGSSYRRTQPNFHQEIFKDASQGFHCRQSRSRAPFRSQGKHSRANGTRSRGDFRADSCTIPGYIRQRWDWYWDHVNTRAKRWDRTHNTFRDARTPYGGGCSTQQAMGDGFEGNGQERDGCLKTSIFLSSVYCIDDVYLTPLMYTKEQVISSVPIWFGSWPVWCHIVKPCSRRHKPGNPL